MKRDKIIFWITTLIIVLWEGVMPLLFSQSEAAKEGMRHLQYPAYFGMMLVVFKVMGCIVLILPSVGGWIKEWAYAGFAFNFIAASVSHTAVGGMSGYTTLPLLFLVILMLSHYYYRKIYLPKTAAA